ncbi:MAG: hypothetical protein PW734_09395 [Verrucomicrobium sp.]|nr:hypothetical protein [Verrucomicrobium sp.]
MTPDEQFRTEMEKMGCSESELIKTLAEIKNPAAQAFGDVSDAARRAGFKTDTAPGEVRNPGWDVEQ